MRIIRHASTGTTPTAIAIGSFDGVHRGHAALLGLVRTRAAERGLASAVFTFELLPREFFSPASAPGRITSLHERLDLIGRLGIDIAFIQRFNASFAALSPDAFAQRLHAVHGCRHIVIGEDFRYGARRMGNAASLVASGKRLGFEVEVLPAVRAGAERISSTAVREALACGDFDQAAQLLGRRYAITGHVVHGAKRGRTLGFPTANVRLARPKPALQGVFAVKCFGAATRGLEGVASLGINPAVASGGPATLEAFLFDFSGDLYGRRLTIEFVKKLRDEAHFASLDELAAQIRRDCDMAREALRVTGS
ncbi:MAG: bifunctional riboflavin kinase/FAD synthetase [Usitatibacter sp.]